MRAVASLLLVVLAGPASSCKESSSDKTAPKSSSLASAAPSQSAASAPSSQPNPEKKPPPCRAIAVSGGVRTKKRPVLTREPLNGEEWIELQAKSRLDVKHTSSGREYSIYGPALALPCRGGSERVVLTRGKIATSVGVGARPGALVVIATPFGIARYGEATLNVKVESRRARVQVETGAAWLAAAEGSKLVGKERLIGPKAEARLQASGDKFEPKKLVEACEREAQNAKQQAEDLIRHSRAPKLGERARAHMQQRSAAREACLAAEAATKLAREPAESAALEARVTRANLGWSQLPGSADDQQK